METPNLPMTNSASGDKSGEVASHSGASELEDELRLNRVRDVPHDTPVPEPSRGGPYEMRSTIEAA
jgi:hypothetical protein